MKILKATIDDVETIAPLFDLYRTFYGQEKNLELAKSFLRDRLTNHESFIFYALNEDGLCVGFVQLYPSFSSVAAMKSWILNDLYVLTMWRGRGVAKLLMAEAGKLAEATHAKGLALETAKDNVKAQKLYESLGYVKDLNTYHYFLALRPCR